MKIFGKTKLLIILALGLGAWPPASWASLLTSGKAAPNFLVESGDNQKLSLDMIRGKVIVLFYESRHVIKKNTALKDELTRFYQAQPANIKNEVFRLVVIDCSKSFGPTALLWKNGLREHSGKEGFTIYGDWNRKMFTDYQMKAEDSNFLIIDKHGIIRYSATGKIDQGQFEKIKELLLNLVLVQSG
ncbi:MAG: TlpA family protein disulfide reductase [Thermodesulfobacteriota bacterium]